jgi:hypothetical protein
MKTILRRNMTTPFFVDLYDENQWYRVFSLMPLLPPAPGLRLIIFNFQGQRMVSTVSMN